MNLGGERPEDRERRAIGHPPVAHRRPSVAPGLTASAALVAGVAIYRSEVRRGPIAASVQRWAPWIPKLATRAAATRTSPARPVRAVRR